MALNISLLKKICETPGVPGHEQKVADLVKKEVASIGLQIQSDNMGNLTVLKKSNAKNPKRIMVAAQMDEIGFIVTHIDEAGFLRFHPLGGFDPKTLTAQRVIVHGKKDLVGVMGSKPIHVMTADERNKVAQISDYFIDLGMPVKEVKRWISVGDTVTRERELIEMGDCVNCKSLDNRVSVFILIEALKKVKSIKNDFYAVFTVQEEVGIRGAQAAALEIQPDFGFGLDTTIAYDVPGAKAHEKITSLGDGVAIKIMDSSAISDKRMVAYMKKTATAKKIKWQSEILTGGGTDTAALQRFVPGGSIAGAISIPTRHIHQVIEMCHKKDIEGAISLLVACIENIDSYNWK